MLTKRQQKKQLVFYTDKAKKNLALYLSILTDAELNALLSPFAQNDEEGFFTFCIQPLQPDQILPTLRYQTPYKKVLFCNLLTDEAKNLCDMFGLETRNIEQIYKLLQQDNALPQSYPFAQPTKLSGLAKVKGRFNRKLCFPLFRCGVMLLFFSFITYYPVYYLVFGGMLLLASAVMLVFCKG
jgi:hypothetical protein